MVKPRLIILVRHAQSEGNKNREIHQMIPDHRVKLTEQGHRQAEEAGRRLRALLKPDDTLQIFTSPYRRTRETTEGILKTLTARNDPGDPSAAPSPFSRSKIKVYEEPRIREQDFGNFQPCSAEMERMWQERADYGHFFYRIPNGESAADAYDRISGFNESLWRQFGDDDFPSVCVLVTHGLMTRVFLMKWYHWSVEYFEDLRNIDHCEFILMNKNPSNGKYELENTLRTWSDLKRQRQEEKAERARQDPIRRNTLSNFLAKSIDSSPNIPPRKWGGCADGCTHEHGLYPRRTAQRKPPSEQEVQLPPPAEAPDIASDEAEDHPGTRVGLATKEEKPDVKDILDELKPEFRIPFKSAMNSHLQASHDPGSVSGAATPHEMSEDDGLEYFHNRNGRSQPKATKEAPQRRATQQDMQRWAKESGMGNRTPADALGDEPELDWSDVSDTIPPKHGDEGVNDVDDLEQAEKSDRSLRGSVY